MNFTPGPWELGEANRHEIFAPSGFVANVYETEAGPGSSIANARLITAVPDLLSAAQFALSVLKSNPIELSEQMAIERLEAAIAKATGGKS